MMQPRKNMIRVGLVSLVALFAFGLVGSTEATEFQHDPLGSPYITWVGSQTTEGDGVMNADSARSTYGVNGSGIKIGVISDSFDGSGSTPTVSTQTSNGDLPGRKGAATSASV